MIIKAGDLNQRITLLSPVYSVKNSLNTKSYTIYKKVWANLKQITLREQLASVIEVNNETYTVLIRYIENVEPGWGVLLPKNPKPYNVITVNKVQNDGYMILGVELDNSQSEEVQSDS